MGHGGAWGAEAPPRKRRREVAEVPPAAAASESEAEWQEAERWSARLSGFAQAPLQWLIGALTGGS